MTDLIVQNPTAALFIPPGVDPVTKHRLKAYADWLTEKGRLWATPDLRAYRDHLEGRGLQPATVAGHLSAVRMRYRDLLADRALFFALVPAQESFAEHKARVDELTTRIEHAIDPRRTRVKLVERQDRPDSEGLRMTHGQALQLLNGPVASTLIGLRDVAIISTLLCTGIREGELAALEVPDLRQTLGGALALHVRLGKGAKERLVPYGELTWCLPIVDAWTRAARITDGPVFRGVRKGDHPRKVAISERSIQIVLKHYPIEVDGKHVEVRPHDCRRTYARWLYDANVKPDAIRQNMGHESIEMTFHYIGTPDVEARKPPALFRFALALAEMEREHD